jgi:hypothetical protein
MSILDIVRSVKEQEKRRIRNDMIPPSVTIISNLTEAAAFFNQKYCNNQAILITTHKGAGYKGPFCYVMGHDAKQYYVMLKTSWFYKFGRMFKGVEPGIGQTFNLELLADAASQLGMLVVVMPEGPATYFVKAKKALKYVIDHKSKRTPKYETKEEGSIPISMLSKDVMPTEPEPDSNNTFKLSDNR